MNVQLVLLYGVPIVDLQITRRADEHDRLQSLRCLRCTVNVATIQEFCEFFCVSMNIACFERKKKKKEAIL